MKDNLNGYEGCNLLNYCFKSGKVFPKMKMESWILLPFVPIPQWHHILLLRYCPNKQEINQLKQPKPWHSQKLTETTTKKASFPLVRN